MPATKARPPKSAVKVLSSKVSFKAKVFSVTTDRVLEPNGVTATRNVVRHSGSVVVLAVDEAASEPRILLERQYRYAAREYLWEIPAGRIDGKEKPLAAARRELREETGYKAKQWRKALFYYPSPGFVEETMTVFLATKLQPGEAEPEADERIECAWVPLSRVVKMIMAGKMRDGKTISAVLWFQARRKA